MSVDLIKRRHPGYSGVSQEWDFFLESYRGGKAYINEQNLFRYFKEGDQEFKDRLRRAYRENHSKRIVDIISAYLFKQPIKRKTENELFQLFMKNCDGKVKRIDKFMKSAGLFADVFGRVYIAMDKKKIPEEKKTNTQADNINPNAMPYLYMIFPQNVLDYNLDENGKISWILVKETHREADDPFKDKGEPTERFRLWEKGGWKLYNEKGVLLDELDNGLAEVPIFWIDGEEDSDFSGQSLIADIAYIDRSIFNNWSRLDVIINDQTFSQLIFPIEGLPPEVVENKTLREKYITLATNRVLLYSSMAQNQPSFISPDASQAMLILQTIERQTKQLYASMGLKGDTSEDVKAESGLAKAYDFDKINKMLSSRADNLEEAENKIVNLFSLWINANVECEIDYPEDFDIKSLADDVSVAQELSLLDVSDTFKKLVDKAIVLKALPKATDDEIKVIFKEIDDKVIPEEDAAKSDTFDFDRSK